MKNPILKPEDEILDKIGKKSGNRKILAAKLATESKLVQKVSMQVLAGFEKLEDELHE
ncbi:MAG: hypothetical protein ACHQD8_05270 [Chitinophagales bacterium]